MVGCLEETEFFHLYALLSHTFTVLKRKCCSMSTTSWLNFKISGESQLILFAWLDFQSKNITIQTKLQNEENLKDLMRKDLNMESLGVLTSEFDLPKYVSTGNSITLQLTFKCFLFDRKFHITLWDQG